MSDVAWIGSKNIWTDVERLKQSSTVKENPHSPPISESLENYFHLQKNKWLPKIPLLVALFTLLFVVSILFLL